jgi:hypothetical protein
MIDLAAVIHQVRPASRIIPARPFSAPDFQALIRVESMPLASEPMLFPRAR